jgi:hypothetical protein
VRLGEKRRSGGKNPRPLFLRYRRLRRLLERFAEMREDFPDRPWLRDEGDQPDVATTRWTLKRELLAHPGHEFRPRNPRRVVRARLLIRVAAASGVVTVVSMSAGRDLALLTDVADCQRRDGFPEPVIRRKHHVIAMPVLPRRRHEVGEPVEELKRREVCRISTTNWAGLRCDRRFDGRAVASRTSPTRP